MKVWLMQPEDIVAAKQMVRVAWFGARVCRYYGSHEALVKEVWNTPMEVLGNKLWSAIHEEWAVDLLRHSLFSFHVEQYPMWFWAEIGRHKFVKENVDREQLSQRALKSWELPVYNPFHGEAYQEFENLIVRTQEFMERMEKQGWSRDDVRNASFQGTLVNNLVSVNAETIHHLVVMRGSKDLVKEFGGKAAPLFQEMVGDVWSQSKEVCPWLFKEVLVR